MPAFKRRPVLRFRRSFQSRLPRSSAANPTTECAESARSPPQRFFGKVWVDLAEFRYSSLCIVLSYLVFIMLPPHYRIGTRIAGKVF